MVRKPHPKLWEDILVFLVLAEGEEVSPEVIISFCRDRLADFKRPRVNSFSEILNSKAGGKGNKKAIRAE